MSSSETRDESFALSKPINGIRHETLMSGERYLDGHVLTPFGIVAVLGARDSSRFDFVHGGRQHIRFVSRAATQRGLVTMAVRFAREIATRRPSRAKGGPREQ